MKPIVTIVGRPNVGKSTLFNRLVGSRKALVLDTPGVTRDRNYDTAEWSGRTFTVVDTGGFDPSGEEGMLPQMREQAQLAVEEADAILFVVDGRSGLTTMDQEVFGILRRAKRPLYVVVNKIDAKSVETNVLEFHSLGCEHVHPVSAEHGLGVSDLMEIVAENLPPEPDDIDEMEDGRIRVAVVGRPNVGKSTLINKLLGKTRLLASDTPGTTRDAIDTEYEFEGVQYTLVDTAGIRRRRSISMALEKFSVIKAMQSVERSHVSLVMSDATEGFTDQDARIANVAMDQGRAMVLVINKWDLVEKDSKTADTYVKDLHARRPSLAFAPVLFISATTGQRAHRVMEFVQLAHSNWKRRVPTGQLNRWFSKTIARTPPPLHKKRAVKVYYVTQARTGPPTFVIQTNMEKGFPVSYVRFLTNQLRAHFDFKGSPLRIVFRKTGKQPPPQWS
jgi:GTP-binding protein